MVCDDACLMFVVCCSCVGCGVLFVWCCLSFLVLVVRCLVFVVWINCLQCVVWFSVFVEWRCLLIAVGWLFVGWCALLLAGSLLSVVCLSCAVCCLQCVLLRFLFVACCVLFVRCL